MIVTQSLTVEESPMIDGWVIGFSGGSGTWFYTPEKPPEDIEEDATSERIDKKSHNFPDKEQAIAFGMGYEKEFESDNGSKPSEPIADMMAPWVYLEENKHDAHWHRYNPDHEEWLSVTVEDPGGSIYFDKWRVELYPDPEYDGKCNRTVHDTREEAIERVVEIMEKYD